MCIAIYKPQDLVLTEVTINNSWWGNPDGAGFMYHEDEQLFVVKGLMTLEEFKLAYEPHKRKECVLHFRIKTHGETNAENTHPFLVDNNLGVVHNGIIHKVDTKTDPTKSDTFHFTEMHLSQFRKDKPDFFLNPMYKDMIEEYIGYSKLIFMDNHGNIDIFNESKGVWDTGCWFSNTSYKPYIPPTKKKETQSPWSSQKKPQNTWSQMKTGDIAKLLTNVKGTLINREKETPEDIPAGAYIEIVYFTQNNMVKVEELLTGLQSLVHLSFLEPIDNKLFSMEKETEHDLYSLPV